jgi:hypothetical protein
MAPHGPVKDEDSFFQQLAQAVRHITLANPSAARVPYSRPAFHFIFSDQDLAEPLKPYHLLLNPRWV